MEIETLAVSPEVLLETLKINVSPVQDCSDSRVPEEFGYSPGDHLDLVEQGDRQSFAEVGNSVLHVDVGNTGAGLESTDRETGEADEVIEFGGREADNVEFSVGVTEVADEVHEVSAAEKKSLDSVLESDLKITGESQRMNLPGDETLAMSNPRGTGKRGPKYRNRKDTANSKREKAANSNRENATSSRLTDRYAEKLIQFKAKLASNQTVLPSELLLEVSELAARRHVEGDAKDLAAAYLDQPMLEVVEGLQQAKGGWHHEMETIFKSYFNEADGEILSKPGTEKKPKKEKEPKKEKKPRKEKEPRKEKKSDEDTESKRPKRLVPSHFIAIQITNSEIHKKLADVQKNVVARKNILENVLVNLPTLHVTLMVLHLKDNEQIERAKIALELCKTRVLERIKELAALPFVGIGDFNGKVVFVKIQEGPELDQLKDIAEIVKQSFAEQELFSTDPKGFQPHLTIMKLSKCPWIFSKGVKRIDADFYADQKDDVFGSQLIQSLQLCAMKKAENGYYPVDHEVFFESEIIRETIEETTIISDGEISSKPGAEKKSGTEKKPKKEQKPRKEKEPRKEKKSDEESEYKRPKRLVPSHFIAIQITNSEIHEKLADVQKNVVARKRILEETLVNLPTLHVTLMVLHLKDNEQIERAKIALELCKTRVLERSKELAALPFVGIGDFNGKVVFAKIQEGPELDQLKDIAEIVKQSFADQELFSTDPKGFQPHLTIMKLSKCPWIFKKGVKRIDADFYADQKDDVFGSQLIQSLQLCAMKKADNGYYPVDHEVFFGSEIIRETIEETTITSDDGVH